MARESLIERDYRKPDELMLEQAQTMHNLLETDLADFTAEYASIDATFLSDFQSAIDAAYAIPTSTDEYNHLELLTEQVENLMTDARKSYQKLISYIKLIYSDSPGVQKIFYADDYEKARKSQTGMIRVLGRCYEEANSTPYSTALIAEGFLQTDIDALLTLRDDLYEKNEAQEKLQKELYLKTEIRIKGYNLVWGYMKKVSNASKQVYINSPAHQLMYLLYPEHQGPSVPAKVKNLNYDVAGTKVKWDLAAGAQSYELEMKQDAPDFDWAVIYEGAANEYVYTPAAGVWLFRCRGQNDVGYGSWSDEYQWIEE